jgi:hypothetical protein
MKSAVGFFALLLMSCSTGSGLRHTASHVHASMDHHANFDEKAIFQKCDQLGWTDEVEDDQQAVVEAIFAQRPHRIQHALWHAMRGSIPQDQRQQIVAAYGAEADTPYTLCSMKQKTVSGYNPVGENFLYMHHQMVLLLQKALGDNGLKCIRGWANMDEAATWSIGGGSETGPKSPGGMKRMQAMDRNFFQAKDQKWLKSHSLSEVGYALEITVHNSLHARFGKPVAPVTVSDGEVGNDPNSANVLVPLDGVFPESKEKWPFDDPSYDWLFDPYGSAVNRYFWKIHGYVDQVLKAWLAAHDMDVAKQDCAGPDGQPLPRCYTWKGTWAGINPDTYGEQKVEASHGIRANAAELFDFNRRRMAEQFNLMGNALPTAGIDDPLTAANGLLKCEGDTEDGSHLVKSTEPHKKPKTKKKRN